MQKSLAATAYDTVTSITLLYSTLLCRPISVVLQYSRVPHNLFHHAFLTPAPYNNFNLLTKLTNKAFPSPGPDVCVIDPLLDVMDAACRQTQRKPPGDLMWISDVEWILM